MLILAAWNGWIKMFELSFDTTRCVAKQPCELKHDCARFTSKWRPEGRQSFIDASEVLIDGKECAMFVSNKDKDHGNYK